MYVGLISNKLSVNLAQWFARLPLGQLVIKIGQSVLTVVMTLTDHLVFSDQDFICVYYSIVHADQRPLIYGTVQYVSVTSHCSLSLVADRLSVGEEWFWWLGNLVATISPFLCMHYSAGHCRHWWTAILLLFFYQIYRVIWQLLIFGVIVYFGVSSSDFLNTFSKKLLETKYTSVKAPEIRVSTQKCSSYLTYCQVSNKTQGVENIYRYMNQMKRNVCP